MDIFESTLPLALKLSGTGRGLNLVPIFNSRYLGIKCRYSMFSIALKMLMRDTSKFLMLVSTLTFATFLMMQQSSEFCGVMRWLASTLIDIRVPIWVVEPRTPAFGEFTPIPDASLDRVRSVEGVKWAVPFSQTLQKAHFAGGSSKNILLDGIDNWSLIGLPEEIIEGDAKDLWDSNAVMIDRHGLNRINSDLDQPIGVGSKFRINDTEVRLVGIVEAEPSFIGFPFVYTTFQRAIEISPPMRYHTTFVLVKNDPSVPADVVVDRINKSTNLRALTDDEFFWMTMIWNVKNTAVPLAFATTILIGFFIGAIFSGQTLYMFILENMRYLGALKAMGASNKELARMLIYQAGAVGLLSYGIGLGLTCLVGLLSYKSNLLPFYLPPVIPLLTLLAIVCNCGFAIYLCIKHIKKLETAQVFR